MNKILSRTGVIITQFNFMNSFGYTFDS